VSFSADEVSSGTKLPSAEKALFDLAYLSGGRRWLRKIPSQRSRTLARNKLELLGALGTPGGQSRPAERG